MTSPLRLLQVVGISTCVLEFLLKCGADRIMIPARSLPNYSPRVSSVLSSCSVGLQGSSASGLRPPALRLAELAHVQRVSQSVHHAETALITVPLVTLHFCIVLRKRSTGFGNHQFPSLPGSHRLVDSIFPWFASIPLFATQEPLVSNMAYLSTQSPLNYMMVVLFFTVVFKVVI